MVLAPSTRRVFLIGFMGAGKTSVGRVLAARLGWSFCDLDDVIERRERKTVAGIFATAGEAGFRRAETHALRELLQDPSRHHDLVVALGGGTFAQPGNRALLEGAGAVTVLLEAPLEELRRRCGVDKTVRPLARDAERFAEIFKSRRATYQLASHTVNTMGKTVEDISAEIEMILAVRVPETKK
ncbi:MAG TPA: shikimate kinase [Candidatus Angelobacter sp.]|nr:shikimate kinase [Candidatus Angelobacter sp.]